MCESGNNEGHPDASANTFFWRGAAMDLIWAGSDEGFSATLREVGHQALGAEAAFTSCEMPMEDALWASAVRDCPPQLFGDRLAVVHTMHGCDVVEAALASRDPKPQLLTLEVGGAFGFGDQPTTRLCMNAMLKQDLTGVSVLDYGCGTGILGLGALLLGASSAVGVDCDISALLLARANAAKNGLPLRLCTSDAESAERDDWHCVSFYAPSPEIQGNALFPLGPTSEERFDLVMANLVPKPLIRLAPRIAGSLAPGGVMICSGLTEDMAGTVINAYLAQGVHLQVDEEIDGFVSLVGRHIPVGSESGNM
jgi:ribosomal protein L11 methylase PrmA